MGSQEESLVSGQRPIMRHSASLVIMITIMHLYQASVDYDLNAQNLPEDDYDLFDSNYPLQEQKRSGLFSGWYKRGGHKRWPICTSYSKSCNISPRSCCKGFVCMCNLWGQNCRCKRQGVLSQWFG